MKKFLIAFLFLFPLIQIIIGMSGSGTVDEEELKKAGYKEKETALLGFIQEHFLCGNGEIFTNIKPVGGDLETLSESVGLLMSYSAFRGRKDLFDLEFSFLKKNMLTWDNYIRWKWGKSQATCNAAIDDMRIAGALLDAYERWGDKRYLDTAEGIQESIFATQVTGSGLCEFYDWNQKAASSRIPLCYLDICTMNRMARWNEGWLNAADNALKVISGGEFSDESPFFKKYFNYKTGGYAEDEEYAKGGEICMTYVLYTALHLAEANQDTGFFTHWLKEEMKKGKLYAWYDPKTLKPSQAFESTAVYALAAVYAEKAGEQELYDSLLQKMLHFMVLSKNSSYYGGFGWEQTGEFYSFDNLTALWALSLAGE